MCNLYKIKIIKNDTVKATFTYLADGTKLSAIKDSTYKGHGQGAVTDSNGFNYLGSLVYTNDSNVIELESTTFGGGRINAASNGFDIQYFITDHLGSTRYVAGRNGGVMEYYPFGKTWELSSYPAPQTRYLFNGKEKQTVIAGFDVLDYGNNLYDNFTNRWITQDRLQEKRPWQSPYAYCSNNPVNRVDPTGMKDTTFVAGKDKPESQQPGTETPLFIYKNGNWILNPNAYNCHSFAWEDSQGDPTDSRNVKAGLSGTKWDNNPDDNMGGYTQLDFNTPNQAGDRVIYYVDENGNGKYDKGESIVHSAIVQTVDKNGNTTTVIGKMGAGGISENHPNVPGYYDREVLRDATSRRYYYGAPTSRAYFRSSSPSPVSLPAASLPALKVQPHVAASNNLQN